MGDAAWFALPIGRARRGRSGGARGTRPPHRTAGRSRPGSPICAPWGPALPADEGALLAYARGLAWWQGNARFCERCGHPLRSENGGHVRRCTNPDDAHSTFPRTDPAVIMLVVHEPDGGGAPRCLLGRSPAWPEGVFSTLAGFVEPGESLEQAVSREVFEESAVRTTDVRYVASQPWPFPRSIMLGFEAVATSTAIDVDPVELADARWFTREELVTFGNWGDAGEGPKLPRAGLDRPFPDRSLDRGGLIPTACPSPRAQVRSVLLQPVLEPVRQRGELARRRPAGGDRLPGDRLDPVGVERVGAREAPEPVRHPAAALPRRGDGLEQRVRPGHVAVDTPPRPRARARPPPVPCHG